MREYQSTDGQRLEPGQLIWIIRWPVEAGEYPVVTQKEFRPGPPIGRGVSYLRDIYAVESNALLDMEAWYRAEQARMAEWARVFKLGLTKGHEHGGDENQSGQRNLQGSAGLAGGENGGNRRE